MPFNNNTIGVDNNNPVTQSVFIQQFVEGFLAPPAAPKFILAENGEYLITESGTFITTEG